MRYRSLLWPAVLIFAGVVALLVNIGLLSVDRLYELVNLWPLILIVIGLELIVRRSVHGTSGEVASVLIIVVAIAAAAGYVTLAPNPAASSSSDFSGEVGGLSQATLEVDAGGATVAILGSADLGSRLYSGHITYSGPSPEVAFNRESAVLKIDQPSNQIFGLPGRQFTLTLQLNRDVEWIINESSGATNDTFQLGSLHVRSIKLNTGASRDEITLGPPSGPVPIQINGGALTVHLHRPSGTATAITVSGGASSLFADGKNTHAIGDISYETPGFSGAADAYRIEVNGGASNVSLDTTAPSG
ncbi:MAG: hypothetical protein E6J20_13740 [Chloroflexi bacterium]|nr:MAG: hypothetical protein E6J20_13740 [Chloroflexota bacterium]